MTVTKNEILKLLNEVMDPEVPVLSIIDLGIVRDVKVHDDKVEVVITPTYSGCPAMDMIAANIKSCLHQHGFTNFHLTTTLSPAWTTEWMSEAGKQKLQAYGIAAPSNHHCKTGEDQPDSCPLCHSKNIEMVSRFGSTACKALYRCKDCREPFDYFKCH